jgi:hypothetical protein
MRRNQPVTPSAWFRQLSASSAVQFFARRLDDGAISENSVTIYIDNLSLADAGRTVWIFGAGASAPAPYDVPTQAMLLSHFASMGRPGSPIAQTKFESPKTRVREHCKRALPGLAMTDSELSLEEVFSSGALCTRSRIRSEGVMVGPRDERDVVPWSYRESDSRAIRHDGQVAWVGEGTALIAWLGPPPAP